ncbi:cytochrome P450 [Endogone sp. FLAS-F59071]|nr:cytochrome P450 [Endogone sp. FLAS-F59071]|eukprot:RUS22707.1 cytochrome P450 [Endogone sp. FLAS-F59071]
MCKNSLVKCWQIASNLEKWKSDLEKPLANCRVYFNELQLNKPRQYRNIPEVNGYHLLFYKFTSESFTRRYEYHRELMEANGIFRFAREFLHNTDTYRKLTFSERLGDHTLLTKFLGKTSVLLSNGDVWKRHRKIANPAFHKNWNTKVFGSASARLGWEADRLIKEEGIDAGVEVHGLMQSIENPNGPYVTIYNHLVKVPSISFFHYPIGGRARLHEEIKIFDKLIFDIVDSKREQIHKQGDNFDEASADLLAMMIRAMEQESPEKGLSKKELRHDTTANALACAFYYLAANPAIQSKARAEILSEMGDRDSDPDPDTIPTMEQTKSFAYIDLIIKESMRLSPSVVQLPARTVDNDTMLGEYLLPNNTHVLLNIYAIHHNPKYWGKDVEEFRPERFEDETKRDPLAWLPFSSGSRAFFRRYFYTLLSLAITNHSPSQSGIGTNFSLIEQRVVLAMFRKSH